MSVQPELKERSGARVRLVALYRNARQPVRVLPKALTLLGRGETCDVILKSVSVGITHSAIVRFANTAFVYDLGAEEGTSVNGRRVQWARLHDGDELAMGRFRFRIELEEASGLADIERPVFSLGENGRDVRSPGDRPVLLIGCAQDCDVVLSGEGIAARHALVLWTQNGPVVRNLCMSSGMWHNGVRVDSARLTSGDTIGVGNHQLSFRIDVGGEDSHDEGIGDSSGQGSSSDPRTHGPSDPSLLPPSNPGTLESSNPLGIVSGRLPSEQFDSLESLWPAPTDVDAGVLLEAEMAHDLNRLREASKHLAEANSKMEHAAPEVEALAVLNTRARRAEAAGGRREIESRRLEASAAGIQSPGASLQSSTSGLPSQGSGGVVVAAKPDEGPRSPRREDETDALRLREGLLEHAAQLQRRRQMEEGSKGSKTHSTQTPDPRTLGPAAPGIIPSAKSPGEVTAALRAMEQERRRDREQLQQWQQAASRLEIELAAAREELKRARKKLAQHLEVHGSIESRNRKVDQRIADLRARVAGAQKALDERAKSLRENLERERERIKARHAELQRQADELAEEARRQRTATDEETQSRQLALDSAQVELRREREQVAEQRTEIERLKSQLLENTRTELAKAKERLEREMNAQLADIQLDATAKEAELEGRFKEAAEKEAAAEARRRDLEASADQILERRRRDLQEEFETRVAGLKMEAGDYEKALSTRQQELESRQIELRKAAEMVRERDAKALEREQELERRQRETARRDEEIAKLSAALEVRDDRLREWQSRIDAEEARLGALKAEQDDLQKLMLQSKAQTDERAGELEARFLDLMKSREDLERERAGIETQLSEVSQREQALQSREAAAQRRRSELDEEAKRLASAQDELRILEERTAELDERDSEMAARLADIAERERLLNERVASYEREVDRLESSRDDMTSVRGRIDQDRRDLEGRAKQLDERMARAESVEERIRRAKEEQERDREELDQLRAANESRAASLEVRHREVSQRMAAIEQAQLALRLDQEKLTEAREALHREKIELRLAQEKLTNDVAAVSMDRGKLDEQAARIVREKESLTARAVVIEENEARLEREQVRVKNLERDVNEYKARQEAAERGALALQEELKRALEAQEEAKRAMEDESERLTRRKEQLIQESAKLEERHRELDTEKEAMRQRRREIVDESQRIEEEREEFQRERRHLEEEGKRLEGSQRTFQAGIRDLQERERALSDRESALGEQARNLESFRDRLDRTHVEMEQQRRELLATQAEKGAATQHIDVLMRQLEQQREELRAREDALFAHEQALAARTTELTQAEEEVRRKHDEAERMQASVEGGAQALAMERREFDDVIRAERDLVDAERRKTEEEVAELRRVEEERIRELEAVVEHEREALDAEARQKGDSYLAELRRRMETEHQQRTAVLKTKESEVEERCRERIAAADREIEQRLQRMEDVLRHRRQEAESQVESVRRTDVEELETARQKLDQQAEELRRRQTALSEEQSRIRVAREELETERSTFEAERKRLTAEDDPEDAVRRPAHDMDIAEIEDRRRALDEREARLTERSEMLRRAFDEIRGHRQRLAAESDPRIDAASLPPESDEAIRAALAVSAQDDGALDEQDAATAKGARSRHALQRGASEKFDPAHASAGSSSRRGIMRAKVVLFGLLLGGLVMAADFFLQTQHQEITGTLVLNDSDSPTAMPRGAHRDKVVAMLGGLSNQAGTDLAAMYRDGRLKIDPLESNRIRLAVTGVDASGAGQARKWIDGIGRAYVASLESAFPPSGDEGVSVADLESERQLQQSNFDAANKSLQEAKSARADALQSGDPKLVEQSEQHRGEWERYMSQIETLDGEIAALESTAQATSPITPTTTQREASYASDAALVQDMKQRDEHAREFHIALGRSIAKAQTSLAAVPPTVDAFASQVEEERQKQTDAEILRELEQVAVGLADYRSQVKSFAEAWDALTPKVGAWTPERGSDVLLEYQKYAEELVRAFNTESEATLSRRVTKAVDDIGKEGREITMRRVIQAALDKLATGADSARIQVVVDALGVVPANSPELKTLKRSILSLTERIEKRRDEHDKLLVEHLRKVQVGERDALLAEKREAHKEATRRQKEAYAAYNAAEEDLRKDASVSEQRLKEYREEIDRQGAAVHTAEAALATIDEELRQARGREAAAGLQGSARYEPAAASGSVSLSQVPLERAGMLFGGVSLLFMLLAGYLVRQKAGPVRHHKG